jgi:hypothetical protein
MCHKAKYIYNPTDEYNRKSEERVSEFLSLYRKFILKLIRAPDVALKTLGCTELSTCLVDMTTQARPYPLYYIISESGTEEVNGTYEIDRSLLTSTGRLRKGVDMRYVKQRDTNNDGEVNAFREFFLEKRSYHYNRWDISRVNYQDYGEGEEKTRIYTSNNSYAKFWLGRPGGSGWSKYNSAAASPCPTVEAKGFILEEGVESMMEYELVEWIVDNDVLQLVAAAVASNREDCRSVASNALNCMLVVIEDLSTLLNGNISWQLGLFSESNEPTQNALRDAKRDRTFISSILQYLKADDGSKWDDIGQEKVKKLCTHLETAQDGIESLFSLSEYTESTRKRSLGEMTA